MSTTKFDYVNYVKTAVAFPATVCFTSIFLPDRAPFFNKGCSVGVFTCRG